MEARLETFFRLALVLASLERRDRRRRQPGSEEAGEDVVADLVGPAAAPGKFAFARLLDVGLEAAGRRGVGENIVGRIDLLADVVRGSGNEVSRILFQEVVVSLQFNPVI